MITEKITIDDLKKNNGADLKTMKSIVSTCGLVIMIVNILMQKVMNSSNEWISYDIIESEIKIIFFDFCILLSNKVQKKTYSLEYLYFASIFSNFFSATEILLDEKIIYDIIHKDLPPKRIRKKRCLNIFAFLKWNRRYFYVISKTLNEKN